MSLLKSIVQLLTNPFPPIIQLYGFVEDHDFSIFSGSGNNSKVGRPTKDYAITLDMAKELAIVERNEKGK